MSKFSSESLCRTICLEDDEFPSVNGPEDVVNYFLEEYSKSSTNGSRRIRKLKMKQLIYEVNTLIEPSNIRGYPRKLTTNESDLEIGVKLFKLFLDEVEMESNFDILQSIRSKIADELFYFWIDSFEDGAETIVAIGGHSLIVPDPTGGKSIGRIGPIYTCEEHRCKGYAAYLTSFLTSKLLQLNSRVILFTNASNPISNGVYHRLGYEVVGDSIEYDLINPTITEENV